MGETPKKYHVTDEGDVYRVNEDGSFTSMGNAEKMGSQPTDDPQPTTKKGKQPEKKPDKPFAERKSRWGLWALLAIVIASGIAAIIFAVNQGGKSEKMAEATDTIAAGKAAEPIVADTLAEVSAPVAIDSVSEAKQAAPEPEDKDRKKANGKSDVSNREERINDNFPQREMGKDPIPESSYAPAPASRGRSRGIDPDKIYDAVSVIAEFPGGNSAMNQWLNNNRPMLKDENGNLIHGTVEVQFVIERDGSVSNVRVSSSDNQALNDAAVKLIRSMPKWSPSQYHEQAVRSPMGITLMF